MLLLVFLLMQGMAALHICEHHVATPVCLECVQHLPHPGHIADGNSHFDDCVLCQLIAAPYSLPDSISQSDAPDATPLEDQHDNCHVQSIILAALRSRAPPATLSFVL